MLHFKPHDQFVSGLAWRDHGNSLYTLSYDGTVRRLDTQTAVFELAHHSSENEYSSFDCCQVGHPVRIEPPCMCVHWHRLWLLI